MLYGESKKAHIRKIEGDYYEKKLKESEARIARNERRKKIIKPQMMPWENSKQGLIKHLFNEKMDAQVESIDAYMQFIPAGSHSGKHRHMSEEYIFVLEGRGYDLHWDVDFELGDKYYWKVEETPSRWEWEQGDSIYIPPTTVHQHFNADPEKPVRFISATSRMVRTIGFDDLEQIENAPEYKERRGRNRSVKNSEKRKKAAKRPVRR
jgi:quercetin dioxygenase-like cupin family protein